MSTSSHSECLRDSRTSSERNQSWTSEQEPVEPWTTCNGNFRIARFLGVEPSPELRQVAHRKGLPNIVEGDGTKLFASSGEFDIVCAFGVLHHVRDPETVISEMLRVARKAIFISDSNNFGQGRAPARCLKQLLNALKLWPTFNFLKTRGKGYIQTEGDGISYSYSVFNNLDLIRAGSKRIDLMNTVPSGPNFYRSAGHVYLFAVK